MKKTVILVTIILSSLLMFAQETVVDCGNPILKEHYRKNAELISLRNTQEVDTLDLPFFDDFANSSIYPDETHWIDVFAYINDDYPIDPVSIGVATLDAIGANGEVYSYLPSLSSGIADYFTSAPIDLAVLPEDSVYLSFYYQAGGNGNSPEVRDSLVLQFTTPDTVWHSVWNVAGGEAMDTFNIVMLPIVEEYYLKKGFQFRFLNYASVSTNYEPSWISNTDVWHLDYVKIDTARTYDDTLGNDVAFIKNFDSMLIGFESMPWQHFKSSPSTYMLDSAAWIYKNTWDDTYNINRQIEITDLMGSDLGFYMLDDSENISPFETIEYIRHINYVFDSETTDSASFEIKGFLKTDLTEDRYPYRWNDTVRYIQDFFNYYAYDDGTAEKGYGLTGQGTAYSSLAYQFTPAKADTLKGVYIYFNQVLDEANIKYFFLTVWDNDNGFPGDTLVQKVGVRPEYSDEINGYIYYSLDTEIYIDTTFYIGWVKTTDDMLNCGLDLNNEAGEHLFYNVTGEWQNSAITGALMIRPVFGHEPEHLSDIEIPVVQSDFDLYPNPVTDYLNISSFDDYHAMHIYDAVGRLVMSSDSSGQVFVGDLQAGAYFVKLESNYNVFKTKKFLILR